MGFIEFETTPNPDAVRVLPGQPLADDGPPREFDQQSAIGEPIAADLLAIDGIARVMIARDFVTVIREGPRISWEQLRPEIALVLADAAHSGARLSNAFPKPARFGEVELQIEDVLDRHVRPLLAADGGEAVLVRFDPARGIAWVRMGGACGGCPSGAATLKTGIEQAIRRWVPEVKEVRATASDATTSRDPKARFRRWVEAKWGGTPT